MPEEDDDDKASDDSSPDYAKETFLASPAELLKVSDEEAARMPVSFGDIPEIAGHENISTGSVLAGFAEVGAGAKFFFRNVDLSRP